MNYNEILAAAKDQVGPYCKACPVCNGRACANAMPGPGCKYPATPPRATLINGRRYSSIWIRSAPTQR